MNRVNATLLTLLLAGGLSPVLAGDEYDCDQDAATCLREMASHLRQRGWVGIRMDHVADGGDVKIVEVVPDSPAQAAGFEVGDVLRRFNGIDYKLDNKPALKKAYSSLTPGSEAKYTVERAGKPVELTVRLASVPETLIAQWIGEHMLEHHLEPKADKPVESP